MMFIALGLSSYNIALFHLINHAFYKGLLFLGAGAVIHAVADNQDFRKYGGLRVFLPLTYSVMLIASLSLVAFPFMTGFYSKDFILESAYGTYSFSTTVVYFIATIGAMFTTLYSIKVLYLTFLTNPNGPLVNYNNAHEGNIFMSLPLIILAIFSIFFGYISKDIFIGLGSGFFADNSLFIHARHEINLDTEFAVPVLFKLLPLFFTISLSLISILIFEYFPKSLIYFKSTRFGYNIFSFFNQRFYVELFYNKYITNIVLKWGGQTTKVLDKGSIEFLGPYGLELGLVKLSSNISRLDTGIITSYALYILIGLIFYIFIPYLNILDNGLLILVLTGLLCINYKLNDSLFNKFSGLSLESSIRYKIFSYNNLTIRNLVKWSLAAILVYSFTHLCYDSICNILNTGVGNVEFHIMRVYSIFICEYSNYFLDLSEISTNIDDNYTIHVSSVSISNLLMGSICLFIRRVSNILVDIFSDSVFIPIFNPTPITPFPKPVTTGAINMYKSPSPSGSRIPDNDQNEPGHSSDSAMELTGNNEHPVAPTGQQTESTGNTEHPIASTSNTEHPIASIGEQTESTGNTEHPEVGTMRSLISELASSRRYLEQSHQEAYDARQDPNASVWYLRKVASDVFKDREWVSKTKAKIEIRGVRVDHSPENTWDPTGVHYRANRAIIEANIPNNPDTPSDTASDY